MTYLSLLLMTLSGHAHLDCHCYDIVACLEVAFEDAKKLWVGFRYVVYRPDFELIPTVKMETRHPVDGY